MKLLWLIIVATICGISLSSYAQTEVDINWNPSKKDVAFYDARSEIVAPPFALKKIKAIIKKEVKKPSEDEAPSEFDQGITLATFNSMSLEEKFTYTMIHPEVYSQACAEQFFAKDPHQKIFAQLLSGYSGEEWSDRQVAFLQENRKEVLSLLEISIQRRGKMGLNFKDAYIRLEAWEAIPTIISFYKQHPKDKDALTLLLILMKNGGYVDFEKTAIYQQLYNDDIAYDAWIPFTAENASFILKKATAYYNSKK